MAARRVFIQLLQSSRSRNVAQEGIGSLLVADGGDGTVTGVNQGLAVQREQPVTDGGEELLVRPAPQVGTADASQEERVAREDQGRVPLQQEAEAAGSVARGFHDV